MAKRNRKMTPNKIGNRIKGGCGQGCGADYKPWLTIQDVPSQGLVTRVKGWKTNRTHHVFSNLERDYLYILEWSPLVFDIREQYPLLPPEETLAIANECGIEHPADPQTKEYIVMTTDFVVTLSQNPSVDYARTVKPASKLLERRVLEKLEIERLYWQVRNINWGIVTERDMPGALVKNAGLLHDYFSLADYPINTEEANAIANILTAKVMEGKAPLRKIALDCDKQLGFEPGISLVVAYHLLARRYWQIDMNMSINPGRKLTLLSVTFNPGEFHLED